MSDNNKGYAVKLNGACWLWGFNGAGGLGDNTLTDRSSPVQVVGNHSFIMLAASNQATHALKSNGAAWGWGANIHGQIGNNANSASYSSPVQVVGSHSFTSISEGTYNFFGLKDNGQVWGCGSNSYGQIGTNNQTSYSSPVQVVGNHSFIRVHCSAAHTAALKNDGQVWCWGNGQSGQLGNNLANWFFSPVQVVGSHSFIQVAAGGILNGLSIALKETGAAWAWGYNGSGNLGDGTVTTRSSPVAVIGGHSFIHVAAGMTNEQNEGACAGLKSNGSLWMWGSNVYGQLGDGSRTNRSSPVQVVGAHSFIHFAIGNNFTHAMKADGSIWAWGSNLQGRLGTNNATSYSSPVQVVGAHSFLFIGAGASRIPVCVTETWRRWPAYFVNISGSWRRVVNIYQKQSGVWTNNSVMYT